MGFQLKALGSLKPINESPLYDCTISPSPLQGWESKEFGIYNMHS
jgi:hypothetical protein